MSKKENVQRGLAPSGLLAALWEQYVTSEDERREIRERLEHSSAEYKASVARSQEIWNKIEAAKNEGAANKKAEPPPTRQ